MRNDTASATAFKNWHRMRLGRNASLYRPAPFRDGTSPLKSGKMTPPCSFVRRSGSDSCARHELKGIQRLSLKGTLLWNLPVTSCLIPQVFGQHEFARSSYAQITPANIMNSNHTTSASAVRTAFIKMTGPHHGQTNFRGKPCLSWEVAAYGGSDQKPIGKTYRVHSYLKAVRLSCTMAFDRRSFLRMEALPR